MNIYIRVKQLSQKITGLVGRIQFTQSRVVIGIVIFLALLLLIILGWDTSFFFRSLSPLQPEVIKESKQISLSFSDIDEAIHILDIRQQELNKLLQGITGTSTISF